MPTGWEVTLDLVRKLAVVHKETCEPDPERWYQDKFGVPPDYSNLLEQLAKTPSERQQLLLTYWEPTSLEREESRKQPTAAHRAIARMALKGSIRVVVTTNFDRLVETALADVGVNATVMSSPDHVQGALPLIHTQCCVFKVHGDYLDARIRNTQEELDEYPDEFNHLLDRILDEFGLVVCGWSAEWDGALRSAILRAPSRRFSTYWAFRGNLGDDATRLVEHRKAEKIPIDDADTFFETLQQSIESIDEFSRPHPLSTEIAVATLKRYLSESRYRIQLSDLVRNEIDRVVEVTSSASFSVQGPFDGKSVTARVRGYDAACSTLAAMAIVVGAWAEEDHYRVWRQALERLAATRPMSGTVLWLNLKRYPATLALYALGLGAVAMERWRFLANIMDTVVEDGSGKRMPAVQVLPPFCLISGGGRTMGLLEGMANQRAPLNDWIFNTLQPHTQHVLSGDQYEMCFGRLEVLIALNHLKHRRVSGGSEWFPSGRFIHRSESRTRIVQEIEDSIATEGEKSPFVECGLVGGTVEIGQQTLNAFHNGVENWSWGAWTQ